MPAHGAVDLRPARLRQDLVVLAQATILAQPGKRPLDDPAQKAATVASIDPDVRQAREALREIGQHQLATVTILDNGAMHEALEDEAFGIDQQMPFASFHFLAAVVATQPLFQRS